MDEYSIVNTHEALKERLIDYIETAYFGKNDELRELCRDELEKIDSEHILHYEKNPYGIRAIVKRAAGKYDFERVDIEELFVAMIKELNR